MQVSTTCRSTVKRWIDRGVRQQPDPLPLGQERVERAGLLERLPHRRAGPGPTASSRTSSSRGPRPATGRAAAAHSRGQPRGGRRGEHDAVLGGGGGRAQQQQRVAGRVGAAVEDHLAREQRDAGRRAASSAGRRALRDATSARDEHAVDAAPGQPRQVGDPAADLAHVRAARPVRRRRPGPRPTASSAHSSGATRSVARPATPCSTSRTSSSALPAALELGVRDVDQPGGDERLEDRRVAQPALGLLEVGHRQVRELAHQLVPRLATRSRSLGQPLRARRGASAASIVGAQPQREVRVAGEVPGVEQPERDPEVGRRPRSTISGSVRTEWSRRGAGVPQRVPDALGDARRGRRPRRAPAPRRGRSTAPARRGRSRRPRPARPRSSGPPHSS